MADEYHRAAERVYAAMKALQQATFEDRVSNADAFALEVFNARSIRQQHRLPRMPFILALSVLIAGCKDDTPDGAFLTRKFADEITKAGGAPSPRWGGDLGDDQWWRRLRYSTNDISSDGSASLPVMSAHAPPEYIRPAPTILPPSYAQPQPSILPDRAPSSVQRRASTHSATFSSSTVSSAGSATFSVPPHAALAYPPPWPYYPPPPPPPLLHMQALPPPTLTASLLTYPAPQTYSLVREPDGSSTLSYPATMLPINLRAGGLSTVSVPSEISSARAALRQPELEPLQIRPSHPELPRQRTRSVTPHTPVESQALSVYDTPVSRSPPRKTRRESSGAPYPIRSLSAPRRPPSATPPAYVPPPASLKHTRVTHSPVRHISLGHEHSAPKSNWTNPDPGAGGERQAVSQLTTPRPSSSELDILPPTHIPLPTIIAPEHLAAACSATRPSSAEGPPSDDGNQARPPSMRSTSSVAGPPFPYYVPSNASNAVPSTSSTNDPSPSSSPSPLRSVAMSSIIELQANELPASPSRSSDAGSNDMHPSLAGSSVAAPPPHPWPVIFPPAVTQKDPAGMPFWATVAVSGLPTWSTIASSLAPSKGLPSVAQSRSSTPSSTQSSKVAIAEIQSTSNVTVSTEMSNSNPSTTESATPTSSATTPPKRKISDTEEHDVTKKMRCEGSPPVSQSVVPSQGDPPPDYALALCPRPSNTPPPHMTEPHRVQDTNNPPCKRCVSRGLVCRPAGKVYEGIYPRTCSDCVIGRRPCSLALGAAADLHGFASGPKAPDANPPADPWQDKTAHTEHGKAVVHPATESHSPHAVPKRPRALSRHSSDVTPLILGEESQRADGVVAVIDNKDDGGSVVQVLMQSPAPIEVEIEPATCDSRGAEGAIDDKVGDSRGESQEVPVAVMSNERQRSTVDVATTGIAEHTSVSSGEWVCHPAVSGVFSPPSRPAISILPEQTLTGHRPDASPPSAPVIFSPPPLSSSPPLDPACGNTGDKQRVVVVPLSVAAQDVVVLDGARTPSPDCPAVAPASPADTQIRGNDARPPHGAKAMGHADCGRLISTLFEALAAQQTQIHALTETVAELSVQNRRQQEQIDALSAPGK